MYKFGVTLFGITALPRVNENSFAALLMLYVPRRTDNTNLISIAHVRCESAKNESSIWKARFTVAGQVRGSGPGLFRCDAA
jgi:hypothetical protein